MLQFMTVIFLFATAVFGVAAAIFLITNELEMRSKNNKDIY